MKINEDKSIEINRGDSATIELTRDEGVFNIGDILKLSIIKKEDYKNVVFQKNIIVDRESNVAYIPLTEDETRIGDIISEPVIYWYEIEYNGNQTIIGYDSDGPKEFILYPEAPEKVK